MIRIIIAILMLLAGIVASFGAQGTLVRYFRTVTDLLASNPNDANRTVQVGGLATETDGQGGQFAWFPTATDATNATTIFQANNRSEGRWMKINNASDLVVDFSGFITNYTAIKVDTIADLKNVVTTNGIQLAEVAGYANFQDGGEGKFLFYPASVTPEDGGLVVAPNNGTGNWLRVITGKNVYVNWWGPVATNGTIQAALNKASAITNGIAILPSTAIYVSSTNMITIPSNATLEGQVGSTLVLYDNPTESYAMVRMAGTNSAIKNVTFIGWPLEPGSGNTGVGIIVSNTTDCLLGGNRFYDFYTQPVVNGGGNTRLRVYDENWVFNSVRGYGAVGRADNRQPDDTAAFQFAVANTTGATGSEVIVPADVYALNATITNSYGLTLRGVGGGSLTDSQGITNTYLIPYNPSNAVLTVGSSDATSYLVRGLTLANLTFDNRGPTFTDGQTNTYGQKGLSIVGGVYELTLHDIGIQRFVQRGLELIGGTSDAGPVSKVHINNLRVKTPNSGAGYSHSAGRQVYMKYRTGPAGYLTDINLFGGTLNGGTNGFAVELDGVQATWFGTYIDGYWNHLVKLEKTDSGGQNPVFAGYDVNLDGLTDPHSADIYAFDNEWGPTPWSGIDAKPIVTSGSIKWTGASRDMFRYIGMDTNHIYYPVIYGRHTYVNPNTFEPLKNTYFSANSDDGIQLTTTNYLRINAPNDRGSLQMYGNQNPTIYLREDYPASGYQLMISVLAQPSVGDTLTLAITSGSVVSNSIRYWTNASPSHTNHIQIGATVADTATALYSNLTNYTNITFTGHAVNGTNVTITQSGNTNNALVGSTSSGSWARLWISPQNLARIQIIDGITYLTPSGPLRILDTGQNRTWLEAKTNSAALTETLVTVNNNGLGINNTSPNWPLVVGSNPSQANSTKLGVGMAVTNLSGSHTAADIQSFASPTTGGPATGTYYGAMIEGGSNSGITNDFNASIGLFGLRVGLNHRGSGAVTRGGGIIIPNVTATGNVVNQHALFISDQTSHGSTIVEAVHIDGNDQFLHGGRMVYRPTSVQTLAAGDPLVVNCGNLRVQGSGGAVTSTATPTIASGEADGEEFMIIGQDDTNTWTVQDRGTLVGSNVKLAAGTTTRTLGRGSVLTLTWFNFGGYWKEKSWSP